MTPVLAIGDRKIGLGHPPFLVLEAGINHNGSLDSALEMIRVARNANADAIKFQTFKAEEFVGDPTLTYTYRSQGQDVTESMLEMFKRHEFAPAEWRKIKVACDAAGIIFLSTPQNVSDLELLLDLNVPAIKVGSDDFTNTPLLAHYAAAGLPIILSCGMADMADVVRALDVVSPTPCALLVCTSTYPTPPADVNVARVSTLRTAFPDVVIGFSDHTEGTEAAVMATALGAVLFEKHFTLDQNLPGPDHWFSANPVQAGDWIEAVRTAAVMCGDGQVRPSAEELTMRKQARRSVTALRDISAGEILNAANVGLRRPSDGLPPDRLMDVFGRKASRAIATGEKLSEADLA